MNEDTRHIDDLLNKVLPLQKVSLPEHSFEQLNKRMKASSSRKMFHPLWLAASLMIMLMANILMLSNQSKPLKEENAIKTMSEYMGYQNYEAI